MDHNHPLYLTSKTLTRYMGYPKTANTLTRRSNRIIYGKRNNVYEFYQCFFYSINKAASFHTSLTYVHTYISIELLLIHHVGSLRKNFKELFTDIWYS